VERASGRVRFRPWHTRRMIQRLRLPARFRSSALFWARVRSAALIVTTTLVFTAGCAGVSRTTEHQGRVVIVYSADRTADAMTARDNLGALGFRVHTEPEGPAVRTSSVVAVYDVGHHQGRVTAVEDALATIDGIETRAFYLPGPDGTDVVVWLISRDREIPVGSLTPADGDSRDAGPSMPD